MKRIRIAALVLACALGTLAQSLNAGELYNKPHRLLSIKTERFEIIFPAQEQAIAEYLASFADATYDEVAARLRAPVLKKRIPVVLSPDTEDLNGYFTPFPSMRIGLYEAPISPNSGFAAFGDNLRKLFLHELTHAVSLSRTSPFWGFMGGIFGDIVAPAMLLSPAAFVEGVTVSFESHDGFGRARDPSRAAIIQQAILEDRFPSFLEVNGVKDGYPFGSHYTYGGWFSRYLQETYGDEAYARLWKELGSFRGFWDLPGFKGAFSRAFGLGVDRAWEDFRAWIAPKAPIRTDVLPLTDSFDIVYATAAWGDALYWADMGGIWELKAGKKRRLADANEGINRLSVSPDGSKLLVSAAKPDGELYRAWLRELDIAKGAFTSRAFPAHLAEASYSGDGILACRISRYAMDLVRVDASGTAELVHGSERLTPSVPTLMEDGRVLFLLQRDGTNEIAFYDPADGSVSVADTGLPNIRNLSSDGKRAWFSWDGDFSLLKLGVLEGDAVLAYPSLSGGVQFPVGVSDGLAYAGFFARGHKIMRLPDLPAETGTASFRTLEDAEWKRPSVFESEPKMAAEPYSPVLAALLPQIRYPVLSLDPGASGIGMLRGAGFGFISSDPAEILSLEGSAAYLWNDRFANVSLGIGTTILPFDVALDVSDRLVFNPDPDDPDDARRLGASLSLTDTLQGYADSFSWRASAAWFSASSGQGGTSPYAWAFRDHGVPLTVLLEYSNVRPIGIEGEGLGVLVSAGWSGVLEPFAIQDFRSLAAGSLDIYLPFLRTRVRAEGAVSLSPELSMTVAGPENADGSAWLGEAPYEALGAYSGRRELSASWIASGGLEMGYPFATDLELPLALYLSSVDLKVGYQGSFLDGQWLDSIYGIIATDLRPALIPFATGVPLGFGLRIDQAFRGAEAAAGPRLSLYAGMALY